MMKLLFSLILTQRQREQSKSCAPDTLDNSMGHRGECQPLTSSHWILRLPALTLPALPATRCHQEGEQCQAALCSLQAYLPSTHSLPTIPTFPMCLFCALAIFSFLGQNTVPDTQ